MVNPFGKKNVGWLMVLVLSLGSLLLGNAALADDAPQQAQGDSLSGFLNGWLNTPVGRYALIPQSRTDDGAFVLGRADAPVTIVEFADFLCIHCQNYEPTVRQFIEAYVIPGKAKFEFRMFPVVNQDTAPFATKFAECADTLTPGMFWAARATLFSIASNRDFTADPVDTLTQELGLNGDELQRCTRTARQYLVDSQLAGKISIPSLTAVWIRYQDGDLQNIVLDGQMFDGPVAFDVLAAVVDSVSGV